MTTVVICASLAHPDLVDAAVADLSQPGVTVHAPGSGQFPDAESARRGWHTLIDTADLVVAIAKPDGTVGEAVRGEVEHAVCARRPVRWWTPHAPLVHLEETRRAGSTSALAPWWMGVNADHVYEQCPSRIRSLPELRRAGWDRQGKGLLDPLGTDVCGWCRRVWIARHPEEARS